MNVHDHTRTISAPELRSREQCTGRPFLQWQFGNGKNCNCDWRRF